MSERSKSVRVGLAGTVVAAAFVSLPLAGCVGSRAVEPIGNGTGAAASGGSGPSAGNGQGDGGPGGISMPPLGGSTDGGAGTGGTTTPESPGGRAGTSSCSADGGIPPTMRPARGIPNLATPGAMVTAAVAPPAVSGGTLRVLAGGQIAVAADPDRDRVYVVDLSARTVATTVMLQAGDEPGRVIEDAAGRVHVALRHGGAIASFDPRLAQPTVTRRAICASPRGLAYDASGDLVHVACADGELVSVPAAGGAAVRSLQLPRDLRDVVVDGARLRVTRFRSAELLTVDASGTVSSTMSLPSFTTPTARSGQMFSAGAAWRMMPTADGGVAVLHQRGAVDTIRPTAGGYGGVNPCDSIVHPAVTTVASDGTVKTGPALPGLVLAVDMAISPDGAKIAVVSLGNATNQPLMPTSGQTGPQLTRVFVTDMSSATDQTVGCKPDGTHGPCLPPNTTVVDTSTGAAMTGCPADPTVVGQPIAVAFQDADSVVVQSREPAMLTMMRDGGRIDLPGESRADTGHLLFHANAGGFVACASCHLEGNDDGRVWDFGCDVSGAVSGMRRTQSLQTGLRGTEPFHWSGDEANFDALMADVLVGRMSGPKLTSDQGNAMLSWIDAQPRPLRPAPANPAAVQRGAALFNDTQNVGCVTCHAGARFSNNTSIDVGTGRAFQVPSLLGVGTRGPFMHDGCAATLRDRFNPACGGDRHGATAQLTSGQIDDLIAYLSSL